MNGFVVVLTLCFPALAAAFTTSPASKSPLFVARRTAPLHLVDPISAGIASTLFGAGVFLTVKESANDKAVEVKTETPEKKEEEEEEEPVEEAAPAVEEEEPVAVVAAVEEEAPAEEASASAVAAAEATPPVEKKPFFLFVLIRAIIKILLAPFKMFKKAA